MVQHPDQLGDLPRRVVPVVAELLCWDLPVMDHAQDLALAQPQAPRDLLRAERSVHLGEVWCLLFLHACRLPSSGVTSHPPMERDALGLPDGSHAIRWCRHLWPRWPTCPHCPYWPQWPGVPPGRHDSYTCAQLRGYPRPAESSYAASIVVDICRHASTLAEPRGRRTGGLHACRPAEEVSRADESAHY